MKNLIKKSALVFAMALALTCLFFVQTGEAADALKASARPIVCGENSACTIDGADGGTYHIVLPEDWDGKASLKPFVFFHGHNGSGLAVLRSQRMVKQITDAGFVLIAPDGPQFTFNNRTTRGWAARPEGSNPRGARDDVAFVEHVIDDVGKRLPVIVADTVLSGFSSGGSMAWYVACYSNRPFKAVAAIAGGLRRPLPDGGNCPGGARKVLHLHGFADKQVPLEGRAIRSWHQGDVFEGLNVMRRTNSCHSRPTKIEAKGPFWCRQWTGCKTGQPMRFCLHPGGHGMPSGWLDEALQWAG